VISKLGIACVVVDDLVNVFAGDIDLRHPYRMSKSEILRWAEVLLEHLSRVCYSPVHLCLVFSLVVRCKLMWWTVQLYYGEERSFSLPGNTAANCVFRCVSRHRQNLRRAYILSVVRQRLYQRLVVSRVLSLRFGNPFFSPLPKVSLGCEDDWIR